MSAAFIFRRTCAQTRGSEVCVLCVCCVCVCVCVSVCAVCAVSCCVLFVCVMSEVSRGRDATDVPQKPQNPEVFGAMMCQGSRCFACIFRRTRSFKHGLCSA